MNAKPGHLTRENAARFQEQGVVSRYHLRSPYPPETFHILLSLISDQPRTVLDVGTGTGDLARPLAARVERVDAVDISLPMIEQGKQAPSGDHPHLRWLHGRAEDVPLSPPYALIMGGESIHWLDWPVTFARFREVLTANGFVSLVDRSHLPVPWGENLAPLIGRLSHIKNYESYDLVEELEKRNCFHLVGEKTTAPISWQQAVEDYIGSFHSRSGLSMDGMRPDNVIEFDAQLREMVAPYSENGIITLQAVARIQWGKPTPPST